MPDHYMGGRDFGGNSTLDTWLALTHIVPRTETIHLGTLVTPMTLRPPSILAKIVSPLDNLSGGRAQLGVGAVLPNRIRWIGQWSESKIRVEKTREALSLILKLWTEDRVDLEHFSDRKAPSNLTEDTLKRLVGSKGRATSDVTESTGTVLVNSEEYSAKTSKGIIQKGTSLRVTETDGLTLLVEKA